MEIGRAQATGMAAAVVTHVMAANRERSQLPDVSAESLPLIVPLWLIRQIDRELRSNEYDPAIFHGACRGLGYGSGRFEEAYIAARLRNFTRQPALRCDTIPARQPVRTVRLAEFHSQTGSGFPTSFTRPMAVLHGGHLMQHFGIWIVCLLTLQALSAWQIGAFAELALGSGRLFHSALGWMLMLVLDLRTWFRYYGSAPEEFHVPGLFLFLAAILPVCLLHLLAF